MKSSVISICFLIQSSPLLVGGFSIPGRRAIGKFVGSNVSPLLPFQTVENNALPTLAVSAQTTSSSGETPDVKKTLKGKKRASKGKKQSETTSPKTLKELRKEGGVLTVNTPIGALNPFALYYGLVSIFLGIPWYLGLKMCQLLYFITGGRFDPKRRVPVTITHVWGTLLMRLSRSFPEMENLDMLKEFYKKGQPAMFVANHNSWMDIPFLGATIGWRNYKMVSKKELGKVPMLGAAIKIGGNIMIDRKDRRDQIRTLKQGINYLKDGVHLCTFPEGTRSRTGRVLPFKNGAFVMAHKAGAPVVPLSIVHTNKVMPTGWMFAMKPSYKNAKIIIHEPVESKGRTEKELAEEVRKRIIDGLPEDQKPLSGK